MTRRAAVPITVRSLCKAYGPVRALDDVDLDVLAGEFVSLLGPSGSGKTTLLGILGGFIQPVGQPDFGDGDVTRLPPHKRDIGVVFQNYALFPHMSVGENVAFPLRARRIPKADWTVKVRAALAMVGLSGYEARGIAQLSGGQRQRVALARAMIFEPRLILMDEPLSALDKQLREAMQIELRELHKRIGATIIYVTHDQREALTMSDRVAILKDGRIIQIDTPAPSTTTPPTASSPNFIGESTFLPVQRDGQTWHCAGQRLQVASANVPVGPAVLMLRPERLLILNEAGREPEADLNVLSARVAAVIYQGDSFLLQATLTDGSAIQARGIASRASVVVVMPIGLLNASITRLSFFAGLTILPSTTTSSPGS